MQDFYKYGGMTHFIVTLTKEHWSAGEERRLVKATRRGAERKNVAERKKSTWFGVGCPHEISEGKNKVLNNIRKQVILIGFIGN